jgi:hypothetical protein
MHSGLELSGTLQDFAAIDHPLGHIDVIAHSPSWSDGVDLKEVNGEFIVIEVNDNPNIDAGGEDAKNPEVYQRIVRYLAGES